MADPATSEATLQIKEQHLTSSNFQFFAPLTAGPIKLKDYNLNVRSKIFKGSRELHVFIDFSVKAFDAQSDLFGVQASYFAAFTVSPEVTEQDLLTFAKGNAPAIVFPTFRACIATLTLAASFPPLTLPIINFTKLDIPVETVE